MTDSSLPIGIPVPDCNSPHPRHEPHVGRYVTLRAVIPAVDGPNLYAEIQGSAEADAQWTYMPYGPWQSLEEFMAWLETTVDSKDPTFWAVIYRGKAVGIVSHLNIVPSMRRVELGHIWYLQSVQQTKVNTETIYLLLKDAFQKLNYRRVEWKCDSLNARSRAAALRLGFQFEGVFRQHIVYKGRNRDTAWFSMLDSEWPQIKANMERWLYSDEEGLSLRALNAAR